MLRRGVTLIELVVALTLLLLAVTGIISLNSQMNKTLQLSRLRGEENDLLNYLYNRADCQKTFTTPVRTLCSGKSVSSNQYVDLRDSDDIIFVGSGATSRVGPAYQVRSKCIDEAGFYGLLFESRRVALGKGIDEVITGTSGTWRGISDGIPLVCP